MLAITETEAPERSPREFASIVRGRVEEQGASVVWVGDLTHVPNSLGRYLQNMGVTVMMVDTVDAIVGEFKPTRGGVSYLTNDIVFLRYLEVKGELRKAIGILVKPTSDFDRSLGKFGNTEHGIRGGDPLIGLQGLLPGATALVHPDLGSEPDD